MENRGSIGLGRRQEGRDGDGGEGGRGNLYACVFISEWEYQIEDCKWIILRNRVNM